MAAPVKKRVYRSPLREARALETRRRIIEAAARTFLADGYPRTTIPLIAREAGVSADTVFHLFGGKRELLKETLDVVIGGDDEDIPLLERPGPQRVRAEPDQRRQLALFATDITGQLERVRPMDDVLRSAAAVDAEVAALREDLQRRQRVTAMRMVVEWVAAHGPLRDGLTREAAADAVWTLTSPEVHRLLRVERGWSTEQFEAWLLRSLTAELLPA